MTLRKLFIDMNAFFASIEQQDDPTLRGRPVAVIPTDAPTTCCIAASYEAKRYGVRTGTPVWQARQLCPSLVFRLARHRRYVLFHQRILDAVETVLPIEKVLSIDEMTCSLGLNERSPQQALALANAIKQAIRTRVGECLTCSIGIAPNTLLAKVAADMRKPHGLTLLTAADLPDLARGAAFLGTGGGVGDEPAAVGARPQEGAQEPGPEAVVDPPGRARIVGLPARPEPRCGSGGGGACRNEGCGGQKEEGATAHGERSAE